MKPTSHNLSQPALPGVLFTWLVWAFAICASALPIHSLAAATNSARPSPGRYLLIVDTSSSMNRYSENVQKVVGQLFVSGMNGQLRPGDTIGIWTFNEELYAGQVPLLQWTPQTRQRLAGGVAEFLGRQRYEKQTRFDKVITPVAQLVKDSDKFTVVLISDGEDKITGTPFDQEINEAYKLNFAEQRKLRIPFVTTLRARKGEFIGWRVNTPPWPVEFPPFPVKVQTVEAQTVESPVPKEEPKPIVPSLIVSGKPPELATPSPTNAAPAETAKTETTPAPTPTPPTKALKPEPVLTVLPASEPKPVAKSPEPSAAEPVKPAELPVATIITNTPPPAAVIPGETVKSETIPQPQTEPPPPPTVPPAVLPDKPKVVATPEIPPKPPEPVIVAKVETIPNDGSSAPATATESSAMQTPDPLPVQTALATPSDTVFSRTTVLIAGVVFLLIALGLIYVFMRRSRSTTRTSLITRSMDRDDK